MREIEFRAKRIDNNEWVYGDLISHKLDIPRIVINHEYSTGTCFVCDTIKVVEKTIGQYAEKKDKNGKKIYEGDIIKLSYKGIVDCKETILTYIYPVKYSLVKFKDGDGNEYAYRDFNIDNSSLCEYDSEMLEVIGNIYDNPELVGDIKYESI